MTQLTTSRQSDPCFGIGVKQRTDVMAGLSNTPLLLRQRAKPCPLHLLSLRWGPLGELIPLLACCGAQGATVHRGAPPSPLQAVRPGRRLGRIAAVACLAQILLLAATDNPFDDGLVRPATQEIDRLVFADLDRLGIPPARLCSDAVFVRRAFLDVIGTLPTANEAREFIEDSAADKRGRLIERLLGRDEFTDYWTLKWCDLLRVKAEFPINLWPNAVQAYHRWIHTSVRDNLPYDQFARALLTASGSNFRDGPANFYRAMQNHAPTGIARTVALTFLGTRAEHWSSNRLAGMAAFFSQVGFKSTSEWKEEIVFFDPGQATNEVWKLAAFPDGTLANLAPGHDSRVAFADWLMDPKNPWFTRAIANRVWSWLLGRGIVHEPDDLRPDNPPSNPELLAHLERELVAAHYNLKHLFRLVLNSQTYQLSGVPAASDPRAAAHFAHYPLRRLEAEVLIDALNQITGTGEKYSSSIPEPFTFIPDGQRAIALADGSITSPFLEMFGRPARDTGLETERHNQPSAAQRLHLLNSSHIQRKLEQSPKLQSLLSTRGPDSAANVRTLYLAILSRFPTDDELKTVVTYAQSRRGNSREAAVDLAWALINSPEFLYRH